MKFVFTVFLMSISAQIAQAEIQCKNSQYQVNLNLQEDDGHCSFHVLGPTMNFIYIMGRSQEDGSEVGCAHGMMYTFYPYNQASLTIREDKGWLKFQSGPPIQLDCSEL